MDSRLPVPRHARPKIAVIAQDRESLHAAATRFLRLVELRDQDAQLWHTLGMALLAIGEHAAACSALRQALRLDGTRTQSRRALGNLLFDCGRPDLAFNCFEMTSTSR